MVTEEVDKEEIMVTVIEMNSMKGKILKNKRNQKLESKRQMRKKRHRKTDKERMNK